MVDFYKNKKIIKLNEPQYIGCTILEFSKLIMVDFHYNDIIVSGAWPAAQVSLRAIQIPALGTKLAELLVRLGRRGRLTI